MLGKSTSEEFEEFRAEMHLRNIAELMRFHRQVKEVKAEQLIEAIGFEIDTMNGEE